MAYSKDVREAVRASYVFEGLNLKDIERRHRLPERTVERWKRIAFEKGDNWDTARAAVRMTSRGEEVLAANVLEQFVHLFQATLTELKENDDLKAPQKVEALSKLADAYGKTTAAMRRANPSLSKLAIAMEVLDLLAQFVRKKAPQAAPALLEVLEPFGAELTATLE